MNRNISKNSMTSFKHCLKARFRVYVQRYIAYARLRDFKSFNDWPYHRRSFIECWAEPGFHRFWQIWNPGITYFFYRIYRSIFRLHIFHYVRINWIFTTIAAFFINGIIHTLVFFIIAGAWSFTVPVTFFIFGVFTVLSKLFEPIFRQARWHWLINSALNIFLIIIAFDIGFRVNDFLR